MRRITVVVADTDSRARAMCENVLRHERHIAIVAEVERHDDALAAVLEFTPRILLCGQHFAAQGGYSLLETLRERSPSTRVLLWTNGAFDKKNLITALMKGAAGFVERNDFPAQLPQAIRSIDAGEAWVSRKMLGAIRERLVTKTAVDPHQL